MFYLKKILKSLGITFFVILITAFFLTLLYYFNIISSNIYNIFTLIIPIISLLIGSMFLGKKSDKKGWLEGLKLGSITILLFLCFASIIFKSNFSIKLSIYYIILLLISIVGGMIGINHRKE